MDILTPAQQAAREHLTRHKACRSQREINALMAYAVSAEIRAHSACGAEARLPAVPRDISCAEELFYQEVFGPHAPSYHALTHMYLDLLKRTGNTTPNTAPNTAPASE